MSKVTNRVVFLDRGNYTTCTFHLHGGTILSWRIHNEEIFYIKQRTKFNDITPIRGGIKFTFPYFGRRTNGPKHGFARYVRWLLESGPTKLENGDVEAVFTLKQSEYTKSIWNYKFKLSFKLTLCLDKLKISVKVENTCSHFPFRFTLMRHSIFRVQDIRACEISGLANCKCIEPQSKTVQDIKPGEKFTIDRPYMHVFIGTPNEINVSNMNKKGLKLKMTSDTDNILIYNPWDESNKPDVPEDSLHNHNEYLYCLGVGSGHIDTPIRLEPLTSWESHQCIEVVDKRYNMELERIRNILENPFDFLGDYCKKVH